jgi:hypothetical protein
MKMWVGPPDIYLYRDAVDFRKSINGLVMVVEQELALSPFAEALYVFCNRGRDKLKLVYWDKTGFALWYKRLEKGGQEVKNSNRYCLGYFLQAGILFTEPPGHKAGFRA